MGWGGVKQLWIGENRNNATLALRSNSLPVDGLNADFVLLLLFFSQLLAGCTEFELCVLCINESLK